MNFWRIFLFENELPAQSEDGAVSTMPCSSSWNTFWPYDELALAAGVSWYGPPTPYDVWPYPTVCGGPW